MGETNQTAEDREKPGPDRQYSAEKAARDLERYWADTRAPMATPSDLSKHDTVPFSRPTVDKYLEKAEEEGLVDSREIGRATVFYPADAKGPETAQTALDGFATGEGGEEDPGTEDTELRTGGGGEHEVLVREILADVRGELEADIKQIIDRALEDVERERTREESEDTVDTWGERAWAGASDSYWTFLRAAGAFTGFVLLFFVIGWLMPGVMRITIPIVDWAVREALFIVMGFLFVIATAYASAGVGLWILARTGAADRAEAVYRRGRTHLPGSGEGDGEDGVEAAADGTVSAAEASE